MYFGVKKAAQQPKSLLKRHTIQAIYLFKMIESLIWVSYIKNVFSGGKTATFWGKILNFDQKYPIFNSLTSNDQLKPLDDTDDYL